MVSNSNNDDKKDDGKKKKKGKVLESLPNARFKVELEDGNEIIGHLAGKLRKYRIKVLPGDEVLVETTPYDQEKGRIVYRL